MAYEKGEFHGAPTRRIPAQTRVDGRSVDRQNDAEGDLAEGWSPHGPEATVRARAMDYELTTRIQRESPYVAQEVVEHKIHDYRLYIGMWIVAGLNMVTAFLTFDLIHLLIAGVAVVFALMSSPGQQYRDTD